MPDEFEQRLRKKGLRTSTRKKYADVLLDVSGDPIRHLKKMAADERPVGSILPVRAAIRHQLAVDGHGDVLLPPTGGRPSQIQTPLSPAELQAYYGAVAEVQVEPFHTVLQLLPRIGVKVGEVVRLRRDAVRAAGRAAYTLTVLGSREKERTVLVDGDGAAILRRYLMPLKSTTWLFPSPNGTQLQAQRLWRHVRDVAERANLEGLTPQRLRVTALVAWHEAGVPVAEIQARMGHGNVVNTLRYLSL